MTKKITGIVILALLVLIGLIDILLALFYGFNGTISWWVWVKSHEWPVIPFIAGFISGHLFFSQPHIPSKEE